MTIRSIRLEQFKCFNDIELECPKLTVLTGYNAAGKSTALQSLLLMTQAVRFNPNTEIFPLNGDLVSLGSNVLHQYAKDHYIRISFTGDDEKISWEFNHSRELSKPGFLELVETNYTSRNGISVNKHGLWPEPVISDSPLLNSIQNAIFIGAGRDPLVDTHPIPREPWRKKGDVGADGLFAAYWYDQHSDDPVEVNRCHPNESVPTLHSQVDAWMSELFSGARVNVTPSSSERGLPLILKFLSGRHSPWSLPVNVGYGFSYIFPLLVALLLAPQGTIIIIDSAEAHLHPRAQSVVGQILGRFADAGLQIFLETHSDHLLNGIRLAVRNSLVNPNDVSLYFFGTQNQSANVIGLSLDERGAIDHWPDGFFDQSEIDLSVLLGWD